MLPFRFAIIGSGWRSEFLLRMARAGPDRLQVVAVVTRSEAEAQRIAARWGVPTMGTIGEALARNPEFVVAAVSWPSMPVVVRELVAAGAKVMAETPPAPELEGLRSLWRDVGASGVLAAPAGEAVSAWLANTPGSSTHEIGRAPCRERV